MENSLLEAGGIAGAQRHKPYMASGAFRGDAIRNHPLLVVTRASVGKGGLDPIMVAPSSNPQHFLQFLFPRRLIPAFLTCNKSGISQATHIDNPLGLVRTWLAARWPEPCAVLRASQNKSYAGLHPRLVH